MSGYSYSKRHSHAHKKSWIFILGALLVSTLVYISHSQAETAKTKAYAADYTANYNGMDIDLHHQLEMLPSGQYQETSTANSVFGKIAETAVFGIDDQGNIVPEKYSYKRSILGVSNHEKQFFNWSGNQLTYEKNKKSSEVLLTAGTLDMMTHKLQLRRDLAAGRTQLSYSVMARKKTKTYDYEIIGKEILTTSLGPLNTTKLRRVVKAGKKRETTIWLADDWDYLIVKLSHQDDGESHQLKISQGHINGKNIVPLSKPIGDKL